MTMKDCFYVLKSSGLLQSLDKDLYFYYYAFYFWEVIVGKAVFFSGIQDLRGAFNKFPDFFVQA